MSGFKASLKAGAIAGRVAAKGAGTAAREEVICYNAQRDFLYQQAMQTAVFAMANGEGTKEVADRYWTAWEEYRKLGGERKIDMDLQMLRMEAEQFGVDMSVVTASGGRSATLAWMAGDKMWEPDGGTALADILIPGMNWTGETDWTWIQNGRLTEDELGRLRQWKQETGAMWEKVIPTVMIVGGTVVYAYLVVQSGGAILLYTSTYIPGALGTAIGVGTCVGGAALVGAKGAQAYGQLVEVGTGQNPIKSGLDANPIFGVVDSATLDELVALGLYGYVAAGSYANGLNKPYMTENQGDASSAKIYDAKGDATLRALRRENYNTMLEKGIVVGDTKYVLSTHAYNSLFKSGRKDIMPDDIIDALISLPRVAENGTVEYINQVTGTSVFVNPETLLITGIWPASFRR